jgi:hypothetical protein
MYVGLHANTGGTLKLEGSRALGAVGGSRIAIHRVWSTGGTPAIVKPRVGDCTLKCAHPCGSCDATRFAVDRYSLKVPGPWAAAIHVIDGLAASEAPARVGPLDDRGVMGASILRGSRQTFVVASSARDGAAGETLTYRLPGGTPARHIVFDAPEDTAGRSKVTTTVEEGGCRVTISAGPGLAGRPLMFRVSGAREGCAATESP